MTPSSDTNSVTTIRAAISRSPLLQLVAYRLLLTPEHLHGRCVALFLRTPCDHPTLFSRVRGETVWKFLATCQSPHHEPYHCRVDERLRALAKPLVVHRLILLFRPNQEKVLSTTHRRGRATYPRGGISLCQSNCGLRTTSTLKRLV